MSGSTDISTLYREFTDALTDVLSENAVGPARRGRLARSRAAPVYEGLLKGRLPQEPQARLDFAQFLTLMHTRTTAMRRMAGEIRGRGAQIHSYAYIETHDQG
jgi:hypothetical protein